MKSCDYCAEQIQDQAVVCPHCGRRTKKSKRKRWIVAACITLPTLAVLSAVVIAVKVDAAKKREKLNADLARVQGAERSFDKLDQDLEGCVKDFAAGPDDNDIISTFTKFDGIFAKTILSQLPVDEVGVIADERKLLLRKWEVDRSFCASNLQDQSRVKELTSEVLAMDTTKN